MISNKDLKEQMEQLTQQNDTLTEELKQIKLLIQQETASQRDSQEQGGGQPGGRQPGGQGGQMQGQQSGDQQQGSQPLGQEQGGQSQGQQQESQPQGQQRDGQTQGQQHGGQSQGQQQGGQQSMAQQQGQQGSNDSRNQPVNPDSSCESKETKQLVAELAKLKGMTNKLEQDLQTYISNQSGQKPATQQDIVQLLLYTMDGMIDWATEYVSSHNEGGGQQGS